MIFSGFAWFGLIAGLILLCGVLLSVKNFSGMKNERYSFLNHFISELGDPRFAPHKTLFNLSLIIGGFLMIPFIIGVGLYFNSILGYFILGLGIICAVSCSLIGFLPENKIKPHFTVAGIFFLGMGIVMLLSTFAIFIQSTNFPPWLGFVTIGAFIIYSLFIIDTIRLSEKELRLTDTPWAWDPARPKFWRNPFLEWVSFFAILFWLFLITIVFL